MRELKDGMGWLRRFLGLESVCDLFIDRKIGCLPCWVFQYPEKAAVELNIRVQSIHMKGPEGHTVIEERASWVTLSRSRLCLGQEKKKIEQEGV